jgi:hypothetical protein
LLTGVGDRFTILTNERGDNDYANTN